MRRCKTFLSQLKRRSAVVIPKSLNTLTSSKIEFAKKKFEVKGCFFLVILIILHFFTLKSIKLGELHWWRLLRSSWKNLIWSRVNDPWTVTIIVYSAMVFPGSTASGIMNMTNNSGPKREPCGTPEETSDQEEETPSSTTPCRRWLR